MARDNDAPADPPGLIPWPVTDADAGGLDEPDVPEVWPAERDAMYRLIYKLEARLNQHYEDEDRERRTAAAAEAARRRDVAEARREIAAVRASLAVTMARLNFVSVALISTALFALAGPDGLRQIAASLDGQTATALGLDGMVTIAGAVITLLYPLGRKVFLSLRPLTARAAQPEEPNG